MLDNVFSSFGAEHFLNSFQEFLDSSVSAVPASLQNSVFFLIAFYTCFLLVGFVFRVLLGTRCAVNRILSGSLQVLFIYVCTVVVYTLDPGNFSRYLSPLPFAIFRRDILILTPITVDTFSVQATQVLSLLILCFLVHLLNFFLPTGRKIITWLFWRIVTVALAIFLNLAANWALNLFFPDMVAVYASNIVVLILAAALVISLFNPILCILFTVMNPVIGLLYTFFFSNAVGKQLTKAVASSALICCVIYIANYFGFGVIDITSNSLLMFCPTAAVTLIVWFVFDQKF